MSEIFDPARFLKRVLPKGLEKTGLLKDDLTIKQRYLKALVRASALTGREIKKEVYEAVDFYIAKEEKLRAAGVRAFKQEALAGQALLTQRIKNMLVYSEVQEQKKAHKGRMYRWLPSSAQEPDPEHQLLYGKIFREGEGDKEGHMPGERWGCQCGIEWLDDDTAFKEFAGRKYSGYKGQKAVRKLLKEQRGYVPNAFKNKTTGNISLIWGNEKLGLKHIILRRSKNLNIDEFLKDLSSVINEGKVFPNRKNPTRFNVWHRKKKKMVVIETVYGQNKKVNFPVTAFRQNKRPKG